MIAVLIGITSALVFGAADFLGGLGAARISPLRVTAISAASGLVILLGATTLIDGTVSREALARVRAPIGLDIGARTPEETAISICAEIIARRTGRITPSLRDGDGPIHQAR